MPPSRHHPQAPAELRRRGLSRVAPVTAGLVVAGGAATVTVAVALGVSHPAAAAPPASPAPVPAGSSSSPRIGGGEHEDGHVARTRPAAPAPRPAAPSVRPGSGGQPAGSSQGS